MWTKSVEKCADVTFQPTRSVLSPELPSSCKNNTGVTASPLPSHINANMSDAEGDPQSGSPSGSATASGSGASASSSGGAGMAMATLGADVLGWGVVGGAVLAGVGLL